MVENFQDYDTDDWDAIEDCEIKRPLKKGDLWYTRKDISTFRQILRVEDEEFSLTRLRRELKNALIWFQTFGKFFGECGEPFTEEHEKTMFGKVRL
jgi:hypothetical protein